MGLLLLAGVGWRVAPLLDRGGRLLAQWPTEDGYFMLTMGRNIALGRGLSVAGGDMLTNGTQPLTTFVWALLYGLVGTERESGVLATLVFQLGVAAVTAVGVGLLAARVTPIESARRSSAWCAGALWFASPVIMPHTMNCLETGLYGLVTVCVALALVDTRPRPPLWSWGRTLAFGVLLGVAFWIRNDAAFLIAATCLFYLGPGLRDRAELAPRLARVLTFGSVSVLVASPWLIYNKVQFGHLMPVSGRAEALTGTWGGNLPGVPIALLEYLGVLLPIPQAVSSKPVVIAGAALVLLAALGFASSRWGRLSLGQRRLAAWAGLFAAGLVVFYGFFFGAAWFLPRYFFPLGALLTAWLASLVVPWIRELLDKRGRGAALAFAAAVGCALLLTTLVSARQYTRGARHAHFQVIDWVKDNVPEDTWIGAVQTGTLGFFHDRTINLDGKVNVAAFEALLAGREGEYVVHETKIEYLVDWVGIRDWLNKPVIAEHFELLVADEDTNLAVLRRRTPLDH